MRYEVHIPGGVPYFSFVVDYDPYTEELDKTITVTEAMEWAQTVKEALGLTGESHLVDAAIVMGAAPAPPAQQRAPAPQYQPPQQQYDPQSQRPQGPFYCKQCHGPAVIRDTAKPHNNQWPADCQGTCRNPKNTKYALATWVDPD